MRVQSILIVEGESVVALNIAHIIESLGYRAVGPVAAGPGALTILERESIDLVLMDIKLKGTMDGIELAERISTIRAVPIVFLTSYTDKHALARAKIAEPYGYITNPFDEGELQSTIEMALHKFEVEQTRVKEERLLAVTLDSIFEGVVTTDHDGRVRYMNPASVCLLGVEFEAARGKELDTLVTVQAADGQAVLPSSIASAGNENGEPAPMFRVEREGRPAVTVEWKATRISPGDSRDAEVVHVVRDITPRLRAEAAQRRLISLVESSDDAIITVSSTARIESWNSGAAKIFGYRPDEAIGRDLTLLTSGFLPVDIVGEVKRIAAGEEVAPFEIVCVRKDGTPVDVAVKIQGINDFGGTNGLLSLIARDVTARKNLDKKLRETLNEEQTRIGQDLHDSIGQMLTGVLLKSKVIERRLRSRSLVEEADGISNIKELLTETLLKLRELARGLIPATIFSDGLVFALKRLAQDAETLSGVKISFDADLDTELSDELAKAEVYHIVEEALNNALRHSSCRAVAIRLENRPGETVVSVCDDGHGLPQNLDGTGLGLKIMRHRAELIGASLSVTAATTGTAVICRIPMVREGGGGE